MCQVWRMHNGQRECQLVGGRHGVKGYSMIANNILQSGWHRLSYFGTPCYVNGHYTDSSCTLGRSLQFMFCGCSNADGCCSPAWQVLGVNPNSPGPEKNGTNYHQSTLDDGAIIECPTGVIAFAVVANVWPSLTWTAWKHA